MHVLPLVSEERAYRFIKSHEGSSPNASPLSFLTRMPKGNKLNSQNCVALVVERILLLFEVADFCIAARIIAVVSNWKCSAVLVGQPRPELDLPFMVSDFLSTGPFHVVLQWLRCRCWVFLILVLEDDFTRHVVVLLDELANHRLRSVRHALSVCCCRSRQRKN